MKRIAIAIVLVVVASSAVAADATLKIISAGPAGEIATLAEANEIRVVFSEPMVVVGKIPKTVAAPWFHIAPEVKGSFRWSGTTTLIFTPDPKTPLPFATEYNVTIDAAAKAVSGKTLGKDYGFSFITPTIQLRSTLSYRKGGKFDGPIVIVLRFNQPVDAQTIVAHLQLKTASHEFQTPTIPAAGVERLKAKEPQQLAAFDAKVAKAAQAAASNGAPVLAFVADDWDKKRYPASQDQIVLETKPGVPPETHIQLFLDSELAQGPKSVRTGRSQEFLIETARAQFVDGFGCVEACNPDGYIAVMLRDAVRFAPMLAATTVIDVTDPAKEVKVTPEEREHSYDVASTRYGLDELGYSIVPAHRYVVRIDPSLVAEDGQKLDYAYVAVIGFSHRFAFTSFGDGHGVWESTGGSVLPFYARNFRNVRQWLAPIAPDEIVPLMVRIENEGATITPKTTPVDRKLAPVADKIQSYGIDVSPTLKNGKGVAWVAVENGAPIPNASAYDITRHSSLVQVTNLGITVKDSAVNTLIFVTRLDDGAPVANANASIRTADNKVFWSGKTDANGIAVAPRTDIRKMQPDKEKPADEMEEVEDSSWQMMSQLRFVAFAEKDGDLAYTASNWHEGITPWEFGVNFDLTERNALLRGTIFTDRGVYKLGEEVHIKAVLRSDTIDGMKLMPAGTKVDVVIRDSHDKEVDKRTITLGEWSSGEWTFTVPADGNLGEYTISGSNAGHHLQTSGQFLVAAYRRPEFRVDVTLGAASPIAGTKLDGKIVARYLFGAPMSRRPVTWTYSKTPLWDVPAKIQDRFDAAGFRFLGSGDEVEPGRVTISTKEVKLNANGELKLALETDASPGWPYEYTLEGDVTDVSRQHIANRTSTRVEAAPWYIGVKQPSYFADASKGTDTEIVAAGLDGMAVAGVNVVVEAKRIEWTAVRRAEGNGFYTWESERKEVDAGKWNVTTESKPLPLHLPIVSGGQYQLTATAKDAEGHTTSTRIWFYAVGGGYTAWERYDHNRIDLEPEKKSYKPGETARIMIKSPWETATALLTTEREGVRTWKEFQLTSTQQTVTIPITDTDIPNVFVSVVLVKGRMKDADTKDDSDPGKPAFRVGYTALKVEDAAKRLKVAVKANRDEYRPATKARIDVEVKDAKGAGARSEVTLWAVDYGVLSLTGYQTPDVLSSVWIEKALQVLTQDSREKIISRRVITPKGGGEGGGGGRDAGPGMLRKDFRVLAFWVGSIVTDAKGRARTDITLPESLTTYRIMAVAADKQSRFGAGQSEIRINKPLLLAPAFPRFLAVGDKSHFGAVVHSQLAKKGNAAVTIKSLDPDVLEVSGKSNVDVDAKGSAEVRFDAVAKSVGIARIQMTVSMNGESDAIEDVIPVRVLLAPETVAAYGEAKPQAKETLEIPSGVVPNFGGLHVELASTAMVGLGEGARYLVDYPYGCAEQRSSAAVALMLVSDLGDAFKLPGVDAAHARSIAQGTVNDLAKFQCPSGGYSFWAGECGESPYLTSWVLHVLQRAAKLKYTVDARALDRAYVYLEKELAQPRPDNEGWWPAYTAWQAFAVKTLVEAGRNEDSHLTRLSGYADRMPLFGIAYLEDAVIAKGEHGPRLANLHRRLTNAILPEGGSAHVEELADPYLLYFWNSNVRSTAIVMATLIRHDTDEEIVKRMVRWLMAVRKDGRWGNTQENAWAMEALVDYYRKYEAEVPDFTGIAALAGETISSQSFKGRSTKAKSKDVSMSDLMRVAPAETQVPVTFDRQGTGTLFYMMRLRYARNIVLHDPLDQGFAVERHYRVQNAKADATSFKAGDLITVSLRIRNTKERRFVAITDPIPAGTEPVESWFATTATDLAEQQANADAGGYSWTQWWRGGGFDHIERHDDRVNLFATRLGEGNHDFTYLLRATTAGTFVTAPMHAEEMYEPEVFGRTAMAVIEVKK